MTRRGGPASTGIRAEAHGQPRASAPAPCPSQSLTALVIPAVRGRPVNPRAHRVATRLGLQPPFLDTERGNVLITGPDHDGADTDIPSEVASVRPGLPPTAPVQDPVAGSDGSGPSYRSPRAATWALPDGRAPGRWSAPASGGPAGGR